MGESVIFQVFRKNTPRHTVFDTESLPWSLDTFSGSLMMHVWMLCGFLLIEWAIVHATGSCVCLFYTTETTVKTTYGQKYRFNSFDYFKSTIAGNPLSM